MDEARENELVALAQKGSTKAFTELEKQYRGLVFSVARGVLFEVAGLGVDVESEDVTQDVFEYAFEHIKDYKPGRFYRWLWSLTKNRAARRRHKLWWKKHYEEEYKEEKHGQGHRLAYDSYPTTYEELEEMAALIDREMEEESELHHAVRSIQRGASRSGDMPAEQWDKFLAFYRSLPKKQHSDLELAIKGYAPREIAKMTGRSVQTVKNNLHVARKKARLAKRQTSTISP